MSLKLGGIKQALALLEHDVEKESEGLLNLIEAAKVRTKDVFAATKAKVSARVEGVHEQLADVHAFLDDLEKTNGGPTLDDSQGSSGKQEGEPHSSWKGDEK